MDGTKQAAVSELATLRTAINSLQAGAEKTAVNNSYRP